MAEIINLKAARKSREGADARRQADANAVKFGRTKAAKSLDRAREKKAARDLDGNKRSDP
jgi:hypothetical protein